jgi:hypothetical protein
MGVVILLLCQEVEVVLEVLEGGLEVVDLGVLVIDALLGLGARRPRTARGRKLGHTTRRRRDQLREDGAAAHCVLSSCLALSLGYFFAALLVTEGGRRQYL